MEEVVLGFDTSNYTTSIAAVALDGHIVGSQSMLLPVDSGKCGLRQSKAVFMHIRQIPLVMNKLAEDLNGASVCAIAASSTPTQAANSYMPVFTVGTAHAKTMATLLGIPCYLFSHQQGHIAAGQINTEKAKDPFIALHMSGGTTDLLVSEKGLITRLGGTMDLHAGQLVDRIGVAMGLTFPAGEALEKAAMACQKKPQSILPASMANGDLACHLSGAEAQALRLYHNELLPREMIALEVFDFLARTATRLLIAGHKATKAEQALVVGGVASSKLLREQMQIRLRKENCAVRLVFGSPAYCADNAAGIAMLGLQQYAKVTGELEQTF